MVKRNASEAGLTARRGQAAHGEKLIDRRSFVAATVAAAGVSAMALSGCSQGSEPESDKQTGDTVQEKEPGRVFHVQSQYNCQACFLQGVERDGKIVSIAPGELPNKESGSGNACLRCMSYPRAVQNEKARVMYPMKRTGERGSGEFERISWDEAIDLVAEKLNAAVANNPLSASFFVMTGNMANLAWQSPLRMAYSLGASVWHMEGIMGDHNASVGLSLVSGNPDPGHDAADYKNSKLVLLFGSNVADTNAPAFRHVVAAKNSGVKVICIDPRMSSTASICDEWIPIMAGTDAALALAMMKVILDNDLHDKTWLANYSCAPLLVSDETGEYLHPSEGLFYAWDTAKNAAVELDPAEAGGEDDGTSGPESTLALTGSFEIDGVKCHPTMDDLVAEAQKWTLERASKITGIDAKRIEDLALEYANAKPAAVQVRQGTTRYYYGYETPRAVMTLAGLCGNIGKSGGGCSRNNGGSPIGEAVGVDFTKQGAALFNNKAWAEFDNGEFQTFNTGILSMYSSNPEAFKNAHIFKSSEFYDAAITGKPVPIDFLYIATSNLVNMSPDAHKVLDEVFPAIDFIVTADPFWTWTAKYSDVVLPATTWMENLDVAASGPYIMVNNTGIAPMGESKSDTEMLTMLAQKVGVGDLWDKTDEEWVRDMLDSEHPGMASLDVDKLFEEGIYARDDGIYDRATYPLGDKKFATSTGRLEFYTELLVDHGEKVPTYLRGDDNPEDAGKDKHPLWFIQYHDRRFVHTQHALAEVLNVVEAEPHIWMHPDDAKARGIGHDDVVRIYNDRGECKAKALVTEGVMPGVTAMAQGWTPDQFIDGHYQYLTHYIKNPNEEVLSQTNAAFYDVRVEVEKA